MSGKIRESSGVMWRDWGIEVVNKAELLKVGNGIDRDGSKRCRRKKGFEQNVESLPLLTLLEEDGLYYTLNFAAKMKDCSFLGRWL